MSALVYLGIIILAAITHATLQMNSSGLLLLYHSSLGKHIKPHTKRLVSSYISGVGLIVFLGLSAACLGISKIFHGPLSIEWLVVLICALIIFAVLMWLVYYRSSDSTELWVPKIVVNYINKHAKNTDTDTEAFALGLLTCISELPFTIILFVVAANSVIGMPSLFQMLSIVLYTIITLLPMVIMRIAIRKGKTVADIQKWRVDNKNFFRYLSGICFLILAIFIFAFEALV